MNMKNMKKFFTLSRRAEGFTLVELIVVIAILAILGGVAVPAYGGYVKKANMTADQALVSEVADALSLYYYSHPTEAASGMVIISLNGADADDIVGSNAMAAVFGEGWADTVKLKYGEWDSDMANVLGTYTPEQLKLINNSSYLTNSNTEGLMTAVNQVTHVAADVIANSDLSKAAENLEMVLGKEAAAPIIKTLTEQDLMDDPTAISNMLAGAMADSMGDNPALTLIANDYAAAYAYGAETGDWEAYNQMTTNLESVNMGILTAESEDDAFDMLYSGMYDDDGNVSQLYQGFDTHKSDNYEKIEEDKGALVAMLGGVKEISGNFQDKDSLTNRDLFLEDEVLSQVDSYVSSVKALAGMDQATLDMLKEGNLPAGSVVILIAADGTVAVSPSAARPA